MKKVFTSILGLVFSFVGFSQSCLPDGIIFTTQAQIDSFQVNYPNCTQIEGDVTISGSNITNLNGLSVVTSIEGGIVINGNDALTSLTGLEGLTSIGGGLQIGEYEGGNPALTSLTGLEGLISIGGKLFVYENAALTSLTGLDNLTSIGAFLYIGVNAALTSLTGLDSIDAGSIADLSVTNNISLSTCDVQSICDYLVSPNGVVQIFGNATGCYNQQEVEEACGVGLDESAVGSQQSAVNIYPNPSSTQITFSTPTTPAKNTTLTIYNLNGQALFSHQITEEQTVVNVAGMPQGVYFVRVADDSTVKVGKFAK